MAINSDLSEDIEQVKRQAYRLSGGGFFETNYTLILIIRLTTSVDRTDGCIDSFVIDESRC